MKRKFLSILLTLAMALTLLPTAAMAEGDEAPAGEGAGSAPVEAPAGEVGTPAAENVAQIGTQGYETLAAAVAAVKDNETITLLSDVALDNTLTLDKNLILDLNGHIISNGDKLKTNYLVKVAHGAEVSIIGNKENSSISDTRTNPTGTITAICVLGELTVDGAELTISRGNNGIAIKVDESGADKLGKLTVKNGKVSSTQAIQNWGITTIDGGTFTGDVGSHAYSNIGGDLTINDGIFNGPVYSAQLKYNASWPTAQAKAKIVNGVFNGVVAEYYDDGTNGLQPVERSDKPNGAVNCKVAISGGTFTTDPTAYLAEGYMSPKVGDSYKVGLETDAVAQIGNNKYTTLQDAFQAATKGDTVKLLTDVHTNGTDSSDARLTICVPITLDLNEHTIYSPDNMGNNTTNFAALYVAADTTLKATTGGIDTGKNGGYAINVYKGAKLTIDGGKYYGGGTAVQVQKGELTINNGYFDAEAFDDPVYGYNFIINCIDKAYKDKDAKVAIQGGYFAHFDPSNNKAEGAGTNFVADGYVSVTSDKSGYDYKVVQKTDTGSIVVKPAVAEPEVKVSGNIAENDKTAVENAAKSVSAPTLGAAAADEAQKIDGTKANDLIKAAANLGDGEKKLYVQSALKVEPTAYDKESKTLTLEITPQYRVVASTADKADDIKLDGNNKNAQVVQDYQKLAITAPTVVTMNLPDSFAAENGAKLSIKHIKGNGTVEYYTGIVTETSGTKTLTFTTNGFSPFVISSAVASIDGVMYPTLAEAVANVDSGKTIRLETDCAEAVTVSRTVAFTLDANGHTHTGKIVSGSYTVEANAAVTSVAGYTGAFAFAYTAPSHSSSSGSSSSSRRYDVSAPSVKHGDVTVSPKSASKGDTVTITVKPDSGYELDTLTVKDASGSKIKVKDKGDGKFTFTMPASKVTVSAEFAEIKTLDFADVSTDAYYYEAVKWAAKKGITGGTGDGTFNPNGSCTRAHIVTFLWRAAGSPAPKSTVSFADVPADSYYAKAVAWAVENGITLGTGDGTFSPNATCTRAQSVTFLYRALGTAPTTVNGFTDVTADAFYADAVAWAVESGVTNGTSASTFSPNNGCTRAQIVTFLYRAYQGK